MPSLRILASGRHAMDDSRIALGKRIRWLRTKVGLTQEQLAERAELSMKHLGEIERGKGNPTLSSLENIADAFGVSLPDLFEFKHERLSAGEIRANPANNPECE